MSNPSATSVLSKLHQKRLVLKRGVRADKRLVRIVATPKGVEVVDRICSERSRRMEQVLAHLSPAERERLLDSLNSLIGSAAKSGALGRHAVCLCPGEEHLPGCPVGQNDDRAE
jgi:DNA-binding MarR family transcriptional regulator